MTKEQLNTLQILLSRQEPEKINRILYMTSFQAKDDSVIQLRTETALFKIKSDGTATVRTDQEVEL